ncbi:hypothetical protein ET495_05915 [Xylanimonas allomyrinae]|uniref:MmcQ/YjbR family DNA-binding protein n=1 Tax=Xylanimonas allomyrinae TaxID=2509459 RepID=A0A4P6EXT2_9MICO|nr:hypothetical protein [Xylanimonas allomyrinae]QAY62858.1 hypothetical protein ET495_05915 [Xylanimonas allomyrinae]
MSTWGDVERIALRLAGARRGSAPDGAPTVVVGRHPFARLRLGDEGREAVQFWSLDLDAGSALAAEHDVFFRVDTFAVKASVWAWLDRLDEQELAEILTDSWRARRGVR